MSDQQRPQPNDPPEDRKRHVLKTWPAYFEKLLDGTKTFELRQDDRGFDVGHELVLVEYSPVADCVTGRKVIRRVTYIMRGPSFGLDAGWCVMALAAPNVRMSDKLKARRAELKREKLK